MELTLKIPENLTEITLGQYQKYLKMEKDNEDQTFIAQKMVEIFCNTRLDYVMKMKWRDVQEIVTDLGLMFDQDQKLKRQFYRQQSLNCMPSCNVLVPVSSSGDFGWICPRQQ